MRFKNRSTVRNATSTKIDTNKNGIELPRVVISTSTLKNIQTAKTRRATDSRRTLSKKTISTSTAQVAVTTLATTTSTSSDIIVEVKVENQDKMLNTVPEIHTEEIKKEVEKFQEKIQDTLENAAQNIKVNASTNTGSGSSGGINVFKK